MDAVHFEDLRIGQSFETEGVTVTAGDVFAFAAAYDPQPMHLDERAAREGFFGELVASGWHTLCLTMRLMVRARPFGSTPLIGVRVDDARFMRPLVPPETIRAVAEITGLRRSGAPGRAYATLDVETRVGDEAIARQTWTVLVPTRG